MRLSILLPVLACLAYAGETSADPLNYNQVSLRAEVQQSVNNDTLTVTLFTEDQDTDPAKLANRITTRLNQGLETARKNSNIRVSSGNRYSQPVYDEKRKNILAWRERGEIRMEGTDFAAISSTMAGLLGELNLGSMQFSLSPASRSSTENDLIKRAIGAFRQRADIATQGLGGNGYRIVQLNLNTQFMTPRPYMQSGRMMAMAADAEMAAPAVEGGEADVQVSADGVIEVQMP
ncbi:MAG: SIMPL domain-containing protein [Pseudomonas sp.]